MNKWIWILVLGLGAQFSAETYAQEIWTSRGAKFPLLNDWKILTGGSKTILVEGHGIDYVASSDDITWTEGKVNPVTQLGALRTSTVWTGSQFVAVGRANGVNQSAFLTSADGISWTIKNAEKPGILNCITWTGSQILASDDSGRVYTSQDGNIWSINEERMSFNQNLGLSAPVHTLTWTGTQFFATRNKSFFTSPDGKKWTRRQWNITGFPRPIFWTGSQIVVLDGKNVLTSADGITWTTQTSETQDYLQNITWMGTQFVALKSAGPGYTTVYTSTDALKWAQRAKLVGSLTDLAWNGNHLIGVMSNGMVIASPDAITWITRRNVEPTPNLYSIATSNFQSIAVGEDGTVLGSPDGMTWTSRNSRTNKTLRAITWTGSQFYAVGDSGTILASTDGATWTSKTSGTLNNLRSITRSGVLFIAGGTSGTILTSIDGDTWKKEKIGTTVSIHSLIGNGAKIVAVGDSGTILTSHDGVSWKGGESGIPDPYLTVTWTGSQFVALGGGNSFFRTSISPDGGIWTSKATVRSARVGSVVWTGNQLVALLSEFSGYIKPHIRTSSDGISWTASQDFKHEGEMHSLAWTGSQFIAVGNSKAIYTSPLTSTNGIVRPASIQKTLAIRVSPATLSLTLPKEMRDEKIKVAIYSIKGEKVLERVVVESLGQWSFPIPKISKGRYLLEVSGSNRKLSKPFCLIH